MVLNMTLRQCRLSAKTVSNNFIIAVIIMQAYSQFTTPTQNIKSERKFTKMQQLPINCLNLSKYNLLPSTTMLSGFGEKAKIKKNSEKQGLPLLYTRTSGLINKGSLVKNREKGSFVKSVRKITITGSADFRSKCTTNRLMAKEKKKRRERKKQWKKRDKNRKSGKKLKRKKGKKASGSQRRARF